jgi:hypothetical protein
LLNKKNLCISVEYLKKICVFLWSFGHPSVDFRFWQNGNTAAEELEPATAGLIYTLKAFALANACQLLL